MNFPYRGISSKRGIYHRSYIYMKLEEGQNKKYDVGRGWIYSAGVREGTLGV